MSTVKLRNINPLGQVDVPQLARQGEPFGEHGTGCLEPGEVFEVDATVAGRPPRYDAAGDIVDYGEGLLAQVGNYELANPPRKRTAKKRAAKKTTPPPPAASAAGDTTKTSEA